jgi:hypothetical protein
MGAICARHNLAFSLEMGCPECFSDVPWNPEAPSIDATLAERGKTHGDYGKTAETAQALKETLGDAGRLPCAYMRESLDLICTKMARIANGDPFEPDHWHDIAGYAKLVADRLEAEP